MKNVTLFAVIGTLLAWTGSARALPEVPLTCAGRLVLPNPFTDPFAEYVRNHTFPGREIIYKMMEKHPHQYPSTEAEWESAYRAMGLDEVLRDRLAILRVLSVRIYANAPDELDGLTIVRWLSQRLFPLATITWRALLLPASGRFSLSRTDLTMESFPGGWSDFAPHASELDLLPDREWIGMEPLAKHTASVKELISAVEAIHAAAVGANADEPDLTDSLIDNVKRAADQSRLLQARLAVEERLFGAVAKARRLPLRADVMEVIRRLVAVIGLGAPETDRWRRYIIARGSLPTHLENMPGGDIRFPPKKNTAPTAADLMAGPREGNLYQMVVMLDDISSGAGVADALKAKGAMILSPGSIGRSKVLVVAMKPSEAIKAYGTEGILSISSNREGSAIDE